MMREVRKALPVSGDVCVMELTETQYESIVRLRGGRTVAFEKVSRLALF
jgi:CRISPR/Cas system-associated protein endoribonuclease Cas2